MKPANRDKTGKFIPGASGNPSGRPKRTEAETKALTQIYSLAPLAVSTIHTLMTDTETPPAVRLKCCEIVLDRTCGKSLDTAKLKEDEEGFHIGFADILEGMTK